MGVDGIDERDIYNGFNGLFYCHLKKGLNWEKRTRSPAKASLSNLTSYMHWHRYSGQNQKRSRLMDRPVRLPWWLLASTGASIVGSIGSNRPRECQQSNAKSLATILTSDARKASPSTRLLGLTIIGLNRFFKPNLNCSESKKRKKNHPARRRMTRNPSSTSMLWRSCPRKRPFSARHVHLSLTMRNRSSSKNGILCSLTLITVMSINNKQEFE